MPNEVNKVECSGTSMAIYSHIDEKLFQNTALKNLGIIYFAYEYEDWANGKSYPNEKDIALLNSFIKTHKNIMMDIDENWMIPLLSSVERFRFSKYNDEAVALLKNNTVRELCFRHSADSKTDLTSLLFFGDTLESLSLDASQNKPYDKFEAMFNGMIRLKNLDVTSIKIDFSLLDENNTLEDFYYYGSKTKDWSGIKKLIRLKKLRVKSNTTIATLDFLQDLPCLETIEFMYCSQIIRFPDLTNLKNLIKIYVLECNRLEDIETLKKLSSVEINVQGCKALPGKSYDNRTK